MRDQKVLWLVIEEDRGIGATILGGYATQTEAEEASANSSHTYVDSVLVPEALLKNSP